MDNVFVLMVTMRIRPETASKVKKSIYNVFSVFLRQLEFGPNPGYTNVRLRVNDSKYVSECMGNQ